MFAVAINKLLRRNRVFSVKENMFIGLSYDHEHWRFSFLLVPVSVPDLYGLGKRKASGILASVAYGLWIVNGLDWSMVARQIFGSIKRSESRGFAGLSAD